MTENDTKILPILEWPHPILRKLASKVVDFDERLEQDIAKMWATMYAAPGIGLAAPQVGDSRQIFVMDCGPREEKARRLVCINPKLTKQNGHVDSVEGCLSFPGLSVEVPRFESLTLIAQDIKGKKFELRLSGLEAICAQHEYDHLRGKSFLDLLGPLEKVACFQSYIEQLEKHRSPHLLETLELAQRVLTEFLHEALQGERRG